MSRLHSHKLTEQWSSLEKSVSAFVVHILKETAVNSTALCLLSSDVRSIHDIVTIVNNLTFKWQSFHQKKLSCFSETCCLT